MQLVICKRPSIAIWTVALGIGAITLPALGQEEPGDQIFRFGFSQKFGATDNIRLEPNSAGTTAYSDTKLSFGAISQKGANSLNFAAEGVGRIVDDPIVGTDSGFRDPRVDFTYLHDGANSRLSLLANYWKPDLAFLDPLTQASISDQDIFRGGGTREDYEAGAVFETGLNAPVGFVFDLNTRRRSYSDTTDPLLFSNETHRAAAGTNFRFSNATQGRLDWSEERYRAADTNSTDRDTRRFTFGLDHDFSAIETLSIDFGHSKVLETFDALPGVENNISGPIAVVAFQRAMPDGVVNVGFDSFLTSRGRETTLEAGRVFRLPNGGFEFSLGAAQGESFGPRPVGLLAYNTNFGRSAFDARLSRKATISDTLNQATETTRVDLGYEIDLTTFSSLSFNFFYADISLVGDNSSGAGRERASLYASYVHSVTKDWDFVVGYEKLYFKPDDGDAANSDGIFFTLKRDFEAFR